MSDDVKAKTGEQEPLVTGGHMDDSEFVKLRTEKLIPDDADFPAERDPADPRPLSQIIAEQGAVRGAADPGLRDPDRKSADAYLRDGVWGAPGSEVPGSAQADAGGHPELGTRALKSDDAKKDDSKK